MHLSPSKALEVHTTELTDDVVKLLRFLKSALPDDPWKHSLDFVCDKLIPSLAIEFALHETSLNSFKTRVFATVKGVALFVLEMSFHLVFRVERVKAVIIAALEGFEWGQRYHHDAGWRCWRLNAPGLESKMEGRGWALKEVECWKKGARRRR